MCGIFGFYKPKSERLIWADALAPELFWAGQIRGKDATGVFGQRGSGQRLDYLKMAGPADEFIQWDKVHDRFFKRAEEMRFLVGHNRAATVGKDDVDGAHPHVVGAIHLVHNGTLSSWGGQDRSKFHSDSHWIAHILNEEKDGDFREVEKKIFGPYALVWHDSRDDSLNFARNEGRPMNFVRVDDGSMWFASEVEMLQWLLPRKNKKIKDSWVLRPGLWTKVGPDHKVREIAVPFAMRGATGVSTKATPVEDYLQTKEATRAMDTMSGQSQYKVRGWDQCQFKAAPEVQQPRPTVRSIRSTFEERKDALHSHQLASPLPSSLSVSPIIQPMIPIGGPIGIHHRGNRAGGTDKKQHELKAFAGLEIGDVVHFFPMNVTAAKTDKDRVQMEGILGTYDHTGNIAFVSGVEVSTRLHAKYEDIDEKIEDRIGQIFATEFLFQAEITALQYDDGRKRVRLWCKDGKPLEWFDFKDYPGQDGGTAKAAWDRPYIVPTSAPEVAAEEKKS